MNISVDQSSSCDIDNIISSVDKCLYVRLNCQGPTINLYVLHYCAAEEHLYFTMPIFLLVLFVCFYLLTDTANRYLSPALTIISDKLKLSQNIAAMTLLAFSNGAPDIISSIVASDHDNEGFNLSIAALLGAGITVTSLVFSLVILFSPDPIDVVPKMYLRENIFYILILGILAYFVSDGKIEMYESIILTSLYVINLLSAIILEKFGACKNDLDINLSQDIDFRDLTKNTNYETEKLDQLAIKIAMIVENNVDYPAGFMARTSDLKKNSKKIKDYINQSNNFKEVELQNRSLGLENKLDDSSTSYKPKFYLNIIENNKFEKQHEESKNSQEECENDDKEIKIKNQAGIWYRIKRHYFETSDTYTKMKLWRKIIYVIAVLPLSILRDLSIPAVEKKRYNRLIFSLFPIFSLLLLVTSFGIWETFVKEIPISVSFMAAALLMTGILFFNCHDDELPGCNIFFCIISFLTSIVWIWIVSNILVDTVSFFGAYFKIHNAILGLTFLALGNSTSDAGLNISLSKKGYGEMAIAGCIAGPSFNLLIGFGLSLIKQNLNREIIIFDLFSKENTASVIAFIALLLNLIIITIMAIFYKFKLRKSIAVVSLIIFITYLVVVFLPNDQ